MERDYYRVESDGLDPNQVEKIFARVEGIAARVFREVESTNSLPCPDSPDFRILMDFLSLQAARVPSMRRQVEHFETTMTVAYAERVISSKEHYEHIMSELRARGIEIPAKVTYESTKRFVRDQSRWEIEIPREASLRRQLQGWIRLQTS